MTLYEIATCGVQIFSNSKTRKCTPDCDGVDANQILEIFFFISKFCP